ncbi:FBP domain-containing protein [Microbacterium esteraromaticum]|uniref:FBP domain-containing protein n=2 Tax=Microbacterium esteraromaticum TaxID=57043 RepID=A0A939DXN6_9MICO|nr:FBP domain-containing protein [Microbacterium esteraromaticum]MBN8417017.1 FBP domain-containing protein [Microbacterium esteraromaticum]
MMQKRSLGELRRALQNVSEATRRTVRMPKSWEAGWQNLDYLGWRDPSARQRGYLFVEREGQLQGIMLERARLASAPARAVMCTLCRMPRRFEQVILFTGRSAASDQSRSSRGSYLCAELDCNSRVNRLLPSSMLEGSAEEFVAGRRQGLRERAHSFVAEVLRGAPSA